MILTTCKRLGAAILCTMLIMNVSYAQGDQNILVDYPDFDPTFESGLTTGLWGGSTLTDDAYNGNSAALLDDNSQWGGGLELDLTGLSPTTTYEFSAYVKTSLASEGGSLLAKDFGTQTVSQAFTNTSYERVSITFVTGLTATTATIAIYNGAGGTGVLYADDLSLLDLGPGDPVTLDPIEDTEYELVWSDEFNIDGPVDTTSWGAERGFKRNNEEQYYLSDNLIQKDGNLVISAIREQFANESYDPESNDWRYKREFAQWTSGSINTIGKKSFLYGRFECRAKVSNIAGTWPAIWTVGNPTAGQIFGDTSLVTGCLTGEWPAGGEIDIMENYGGGILGNYAVAGSGRWRAKWDSRWLAVSSFGDPNWEDDYHVWTLEWTEEKLTIYIDGIFINEMSTSVANNNDSYRCPGNAPFKNTPQAVWLNLAMGGNAGGNTSNVPDSTVYLVDYFRVYQLNANNCMASDITPYQQINGGSWNVASTATLNVGDDIEYRPHPYLEGTWSWTGPNGFTSDTRILTLSNVTLDDGGDYIATYTNTCGEESTHTYSLTVTGAQLLDDPGFETGASTYLWGGSSVVTNDVYAGSYAVQLEDNSQWGGGYEQLVTGLSSNTTYQFSAYVKGAAGTVGVKEFGASQKYASFSNDAYQKVSVSFTTGANSTSAKVYVYNPTGGAARLYADNVELVEVSGPSSARNLEGEPLAEKIGVATGYVSLLPNPVTSGVVSLGITDSGDYDYAILSLNGNVLISGQANKHNNTLDVTDLKSGMYLLRLSSDNYTDTMRLIVH